jgi:microsomal dipeptidase-like Zn-dependent dipeptidase
MYQGKYVVGFKEFIFRGNGTNKISLLSHSYAMTRLESDKDVDEYINRLEGKYTEGEIKKIVSEYRKRVVNQVLAKENNYGTGCSG